jgi:hypothetical protein
MSQVIMNEPRSVTRLLFGAAIRAAVTEGERAELVGALSWYEMKWQAQDRAQQAAQVEPTSAGEAGT